MFKTFNSSLRRNRREVILTVAYKLYPNADMKLVEEYVKLVSDNFQSDVEPLMFRNNPDGCRKEINAWVETATQNKIKDILQSGSVSADTGMVVVNAIYFMGEWRMKFDVNDTYKEDFHGLGGVTQKVDMMRKRLKFAWFSHRADLQCKVLRLEYIGSYTAMVVILPDAVDGLPKLEAALNVQNLQQLVRVGRSKEVDVFLSKFKIETSLEIMESLQNMGMLDLFNMAKADLSGIGEHLFVSDVFHKAYVSVDEDGTEAAVRWTTDGQMNARHYREVFRADKPLMFLIWDHRVKIPLFMGRYVKA